MPKSMCIYLSIYLSVHFIYMYVCLYVHTHKSMHDKETLTCRGRSKLFPLLGKAAFRRGCSASYLCRQAGSVFKQSLHQRGGCLYSFRGSYMKAWGAGKGTPIREIPKHDEHAVRQFHSVLRILFKLRQPALNTPQTAPTPAPTQA